MKTLPFFLTVLATGLTVSLVSDTVADIPSHSPSDPGATGSHLFGVTVFDNAVYSAGRTQTILRSDAAGTWTAERLELEDESWRGIAQDGERVVAAGRNGGIAVSNDGIEWQTFEEVSGERLTGLTHLAGHFWAYGETGTLLRSADGIDWEAQATGSVQTLRGIAFDPGTSRYVVVGDTGNVLISTDGELWQAHETDPAWEFVDVAYATAGFIAAARGGRVLRSTDGESWTLLQESIGHEHLGAIAYGNGHYVIAGGLGQDTVFFVSDNGDAWQEAQVPLPALITNLTFVDDRFLAAGYSGTVLQSNNGLDWEILHTAIRTDVFGLAETADNHRVAVGEHGQILHSTEGGSWRRVPLPNADWLWDIAKGDGTLVAVGDNGAILRSTDGEQWQRIEISDTARLGSVAYGEGRFLAVGEDGVALRSDDGGLSWESGSLPGGRMYWSLTYGNGSWVAVGENAVAVSPDGLDWEETLFDEAVTLNAVAFLEGEGFVLAGSQFAFEDGAVTVEFAGWLAHSENGQNWEILPPQPGVSWWTASGGAGWLSAFSPYGEAALSADGREWEVTELLPADTPFASEGWVNTVHTGEQGVTLTGRNTMTHIYALPPLIRALAGDHTVDLLGEVTLSGESGGTGPFTYQWFRDGVPLDGETDPTLHLNEADRDAIGDYLLQVSGPGGQTQSPAVLLVVRFDYDAWVAATFDESASPETTEPGADPENVGVANLLAYAFDSDPASTRSLLPQAAIETLTVDDQEAAYPTLTFTRSLGVDDLTFLPESSEDLQTWTPLPLEQIVRVERSGTRELVTIRGATPLTENTPPTFFRLSVKLED